MWRISGKTIFPRWQKIRQTAANCKNSKPKKADVRAITVIADEKRNSYGDGSKKQHANKQQQRCWDDPQFHFNGLCNDLLETVGWVGATAFCLNVQHRLCEKPCSDEKRRKCPFSDFVYTMPRGRHLHSQFTDVSKIGGSPDISKALNGAQPVQPNFEELSLNKEETSLCVDIQHNLCLKPYSDEKNKYAISTYMNALSPDITEISKEGCSPNFSESFSASQEIQPQFKELSLKDQASPDDILQELNKLTINSVSAIENSVGMMFLAQDKDQAFQFFKGSAQLGCAKGLFNLAVCYETGCGTNVNLTKAAFYYEQAALKGHSVALYNLAVYTIKGLGGISADFEKGMKLLKKAVKKGVPQAQVCLGVHYLEQENYSKAYKMFSVAALKDVNGKYYLGLCFENGWGVAKNEVVATEMYAQAARDGHEEATLKLASSYEHGNKDIDPDPDFSITLYNMLAENGHEGGKHALKALREKQNSKWKITSKEKNDYVETSVSKKIGIHTSASVPELKNYDISNNLSHSKFCSTTVLPSMLQLSSIYNSSNSFIPHVKSNNMKCHDISVIYTFDFQRIVPYICT